MAKSPLSDCFKCKLIDTSSIAPVFDVFDVSTSRNAFVDRLRRIRVANFVENSLSDAALRHILPIFPFPLGRSCLSYAVRNCTVEEFQQLDKIMFAMRDTTADNDETAVVIGPTKPFSLLLLLPTALLSYVFQFLDPMQTLLGTCYLVNWEWANVVAHQSSFCGIVGKIRHNNIKFMGIVVPRWIDKIIAIKSDGNDEGLALYTYLKGFITLPAPYQKIHTVSIVNFTHYGDSCGDFMQQILLKIPYLTKIYLDHSFSLDLCEIFKHPALTNLTAKSTIYKYQTDKRIAVQVSPKIESLVLGDIENNEPLIGYYKLDLIFARNLREMALLGFEWINVTSAVSLEKVDILLCPSSVECGYFIHQGIDLSVRNSVVIVPQFINDIFEAIKDMKYLDFSFSMENKPNQLDDGKDGKDSKQGGKRIKRRKFKCTFRQIRYVSRVDYKYNHTILFHGLLTIRTTVNSKSVIWLLFRHLYECAPGLKRLYLTGFFEEFRVFSSPVASPVASPVSSRNRALFRASKNMCRVDRECIGSRMCKDEQGDVAIMRVGFTDEGLIKLVCNRGVSLRLLSRASIHLKNTGVAHYNYPSSDVYWSEQAVVASSLRDYMSSANVTHVAVAAPNCLYCNEVH